MSFSERERRRFWWPGVVDSLIVLVLGLAVLTWFRGDTIIMTSASVWPLNWEMFLEKTLSVWDDSIGTGHVDARQIAALPLALVGVGMAALGIPLSLAQKLLFYFWFAGSGLAMLWLCYVFRFPRLARVGAALLYLTSPYALITVWSQTDGLTMPLYLGAPLGAGLFVFILSRWKGITAILLANLILLASLFSAALTNPAFAVVFSLPILVATVGYLGLHPDRWRGVVWRTGLFGMVALGLSAFWIIPLVMQVSDEFTQASHQIIQAEDPSRILRSDVDTYGINSVRAVDALRLTGLWSVTAKHAGDPYYAWGEFTQEPAVRTLSFLLPALIGIGLLASIRQPRGVFFGLLFLVSGFSVLGIFPPGEEQRLAWHTAFPPLLRAFRATYGKWGVLLAMSAAPLAGLGLAALTKVFNRQRQQWWPAIAAAVLLLAFVGVQGRPVWNGDVIHPPGHVLQAARVRVPAFYDDLRQWTEKYAETFRILPLPMSKTGSTGYRWGDSGYVGGDFIRWYSPHHPVLFAGTRNPLMLALVEAIDSSTFASDQALQKVMGLLNARYVLMHHDFYWPLNDNFMMFNDAEPIAAFLRRGLWEKVTRIGDLELLQPPPTSFIPKVYAAPRLTYVVSSGPHLADALTFPDTPAAPALYVHDIMRPADEAEFARTVAQEFVVTTSFDEEKVAQARRDLSDARSARSAFAEAEERKISLLQRSININEGRSLIIPRAGRYAVAVAASRLSDKNGRVLVSLTDATGKQHAVTGSLNDMATDHYAVLGYAELPAGSISFTLMIDDQKLPVVTPGTLILRASSEQRLPPPPTVTFSQELPTRYRVHVQGATQPFLLVLSETFHIRWKATADGVSLLHLPINGYANAWWVTRGGDFDVSINFVQQRFVWVGMALTGATLLIVFSVLAGDVFFRYIARHIW